VAIFYHYEILYLKRGVLHTKTDQNGAKWQFFEREKRIYKAAALCIFHNKVFIFLDKNTLLFVQSAQ